MPYLEDEARKAELVSAYSALRSVMPRTKGELNFVITHIMQCYLYREKVNYDRISDTLSSCHEAEQEFRRRVLAPYEDKKCELNGDVFS